MTRLRTAWAAAPLALLMACGAGADDGAARACTMIGSSAGIGIVVEAPLATSAVAVQASVCWDGECVDAESPLTPGQTAVDRGCDGDDPDSVCSAVMTPDGTMQGFVEAPGLPAGEVEVTTLVTRSDGSEAHRAVTRATAEPTYPNGKDCDPGGNQARVTLP